MLALTGVRRVVVQIKAIEKRRVDPTLLAGGRYDAHVDTSWNTPFLVSQDLAPASIGLTDYSEVDILFFVYKSVDVRAQAHQMGHVLAGMTHTWTRRGTRSSTGPYGGKFLGTWESSTGVE